ASGEKGTGGEGRRSFGPYDETAGEGGDGQTAGEGGHGQTRHTGEDGGDRRDGEGETGGGAGQSETRRDRGQGHAGGCRLENGHPSEAAAGDRETGVRDHGQGGGRRG